MQTPIIKATFRLDDQGKPVLIQREGRKHYRIRLQIEGAPQNTYAVTYILHPTYYEPVRESRDRSLGFHEDLTSYGDYTVQAKIRTEDGVFALASPLSQALAIGHETNRTPEINAALEDIRDN